MMQKSTLESLGTTKSYTTHDNLRNVFSRTMISLLLIRLFTIRQDMLVSIIIDSLIKAKATYFYIIRAILYQVEQCDLVEELCFALPLLAPSSVFQMSFRP